MGLVVVGATGATLLILVLLLSGSPIAIAGMSETNDGLFDNVGDLEVVGVGDGNGRLL